MASKAPQKIAKGQQAIEDQGDGRPINERGVYVHSESGAFLEALSKSAADAFVHFGFRPATQDEVTEYDKRVKAAKQEQLDVFKKQQESKLVG